MQDNPHSPAWWSWRLQYELEEASQVNVVSQSIGGDQPLRGQWAFASQLDRIAIVCILDNQGRYTPCSGGACSGDATDKYVVHDYDRDYTFTWKEFPEWHHIERMREAVYGVGGRPGDLGERVKQAIDDAKARYAQALKLVGR